MYISIYDTDMCVSRVDLFVERRSHIIRFMPSTGVRVYGRRVLRVCGYGSFKSRRESSSGARSLAKSAYEA